MINMILVMSVVSAILTAALRFLRPFLSKRIGPSSWVLAWCVVLMVSLVPIRQLLPEAAMSPVPTISDTVESVIAPVITTMSGAAVPADFPQTAVSAASHARSAALVDTGLIAALVWSAGAMFFLLRGGASYFLLVRKLEAACVPARESDLSVWRTLPLKAEIYRCRAAPTPMLMGIFKPRLYLPEREYEDSALRSILLHELVHFRRKDIFVKWLAFFANAVHWFNPAHYLMRRELARECELAADEAVIKQMDADTRMKYAHLLLDIVSAKRMHVGAPTAAFAADKKMIKERLEVIMNYKKKTALSVILSVVLMVSLALGAVAASGSAVSLMKAGDIVQIGGLDWRVLDVQDGKALVLSEKVVSKTWYYPDTYVPLKTWEESSLRLYLNEEFFDSVFSAEEKERILKTSVANNDNPWYDTTGGNDTEDKVFVLSLEEVLHYTGSIDELKNVRKATYFISDQHNAQRVAETPDGDAAWWWLRTTGAYEYLCHVNFSHATVVLANGSVSVFGDMVGNEFGGVRPAMWITLQPAEGGS